MTFYRMDEDYSRRFRSFPRSAWERTQWTLCVPLLASYAWPCHAHMNAERGIEVLREKGRYPTIRPMSIQCICRPAAVCGESITTLRPSGL